MRGGEQNEQKVRDRYIVDTTLQKHADRLALAEAKEESEEASERGQHEQDEGTAWKETV